MNANFLGDIEGTKRRLEQIAKDPNLTDKEKTREGAKAILPILKNVNSFFVLAIASGYIKNAYGQMKTMAATKTPQTDAQFEKMAQDLKFQFYKAASQLETRHQTKDADLAAPDIDATLKAKIEAREKKTAGANVEAVLSAQATIMAVLPPKLAKLVAMMGPSDEATVRKNLADAKRLTMEQKIAVEKVSIMTSPDAEIAAFCNEVASKVTGAKVRTLFNAVAKNVSGDDLGALVTKGVPFITNVVEDVANDRYGKSRNQASAPFQTAVKRVATGLEKAVVESGFLDSKVNVASHVAKHLKAVDDARNGFLKPQA